MSTVTDPTERSAGPAGLDRYRTLEARQQPTWPDQIGRAHV